MNQSYLPDGLILKPPRPKGVSFGGEFRFRILDEFGNVKRETDYSANLVTNYGLDTIGNTSVGNFAAFLRIGTGSTAAAYTDTQLVSQSASTSNNVSSTNVNNGGPNYETAVTVTYNFALGAVVGNMAEIGAGTAATGATLCSRALIVDNVGSPTTITVLASEILQVIYRFTCYPNLVDSTGSVTIGGVSYGYTSRQFSVATVLLINPQSSAFFGTIFTPTAYNGAISAYTGVGPAGASASFASGAMLAYTAGNYYRDFTLSAALADANVSGGITAIKFTLGSGGGVFQTQIGFGAAIPKDNTKALTITLRQFFSHH